MAYSYYYQFYAGKATYLPEYKERFNKIQNELISAKKAYSEIINKIIDQGKGYGKWFNCGTSFFTC